MLRVAGVVTGRRILITGASGGVGHWDRRIRGNAVLTVN
jgi:FlaA1/EpsC-like NDP-sugar epimerase